MIQSKMFQDWKWCLFQEMQDSKMKFRWIALHFGENTRVRNKEQCPTAAPKRKSSLSTLVSGLRDSLMLRDSVAEVLDPLLRTSGNQSVASKHCERRFFKEQVSSNPLITSPTTFVMLSHPDARFRKQNDQGHVTRIHQIDLDSYYGYCHPHQVREKERSDGRCVDQRVVRSRSVNLDEKQDLDSITTDPKSQLIMCSHFHFDKHRLFRVKMMIQYGNLGGAHKVFTQTFGTLAIF